MGRCFSFPPLRLTFRNQTLHRNDLERGHRGTSSIRDERLCCFATPPSPMTNCCPGMPANVELDANLHQGGRINPQDIRASHEEIANPYLLLGDGYL